MYNRRVYNVEILDICYLLPAFQMAGQPEESIVVLTMLANNAITERRFRDASYFYWLLSQLSLNLSKSAEEIKLMFLKYSDKADIYYAYHEVYKYLVRFGNTLQCNVLLCIY